MILKYLRHVLRHKYFVFIEACKLHIPWLGLIHDASKFQLRELVPYAKHFYGCFVYESLADVPIYIKTYHLGLVSFKKDVEAAFNVAWNSHQKHNKHHWQYWCLMNDTSEPQMQALPMPERYIREMVADWRGAGRAYGNPNTLEWYNQSKDKQIMHPATRKRVGELLNITVAKEEL